MAALIGLVAINILQGAMDLTPASVIGAIVAPTGATARTCSSGNCACPRAVAGLLAGGALGVAGALMQSATRNRLASPDLLGVTPERTWR